MSLSSARAGDGAVTVAAAIAAAITAAVTAAANGGNPRLARRPGTVTPVINSTPELCYPAGASRSRPINARTAPPNQDRAVNTRNTRNTRIRLVAGEGGIGSVRQPDGSEGGDFDRPADFYIPDHTVCLVATGGTIASLRQPDGSTRAVLSGYDLLERLPAPAAADVDTRELEPVNSFAIDSAGMIDIAQRIYFPLSNEDTDGVIVTQGTDTLEEVAFLLELFLRPEKPFVVTGAQRPADHAEPDGPANLADAIEIASAEGERARACGVVVCCAGEVHSAREVVKTRTGVSLSVFSSPNSEPLAVKDDNGQWKWRSSLSSSVRLPPALHAAAQPVFAGAAPFARNVFLFRASLGDDGALLRLAIDGGARALVIEGFGAGDITPRMAAAVSLALEKKIPVVMATRCPVGRARPVYGGDGGGHALAKAGVIFAPALSGAKLRVLVSVLLGAGVTDLAGHIASLGETADGQ